MLKFNQLVENLVEFVCNDDPDRKVTSRDLKELERYLDKIWSSLDVDIKFTRHFLDRVNDTRNKKQITVCELEDMFTDVLKEYGGQLTRAVKSRKEDEIEGVLSDMSSNINVPFVLEWDKKKKEFVMIKKTIMRKRGFRPNNPREKVYRVG